MKKKLIIGIIISIGGVIFLLSNQTGNEVLEDNLGYNTNLLSKQIVIEIKGEVNRPGVYSINSEERLYSLIKVAGGLTGFAESDQINLAQKLSDGMVITIPRKQIKESEITHDNTLNKVSINKATVSELITLKGIGESRAKNIIDYRNTNGPFINLEGLLNVPGISETIFSQIKDDITL